MVRELAAEVAELNPKIDAFDKQIEAAFRDHHLADNISSMPGIGTLLGADRLAGYSGLAPSTP